MRNLTDKELKREFHSPRNQLQLGLMGLIFLAVGVVALLFLTFDPLSWLAGDPPVREAKKVIAMSICFILLPTLAGVWFMMVRPLQTGVVVSTRRSGTTKVILRSEDPAGFRSLIWWNGFMLVAALSIGLYCLVGGIRDLQKAKTLTASERAASNPAGSPPAESARSRCRVSGLQSLPPGRSTVTWAKADAPDC
jgi:hypothetical protein